MGTIFKPTSGPRDWRELLTEPKHWRTGYSAKTLAHCWEEAEGFPPEITKLFQESDEPGCRNIKYLLAFPEWRVSLPGGSQPSQNDLFVLANSDDGLIAIMIEGKVSEPFGDTIEKWLVDASPGKTQRLDFLKNQLGLSQIPGTIRYQLVHRTASAVIEANRFGAKRAMMIVHSFSQTDQWIEDFRAFLHLFEVTAKPEGLVFVGETQGVKLYCGWVKGNSKYLAY
jgi:hypothetical protein